MSTHRKRMYQRAPAPYSCWGEHGLARLRAGVDIRSLERAGASASDIAREVRDYCLKTGEAVPAPAGWVRRTERRARIERQRKRRMRAREKRM